MNEPIDGQSMTVPLDTLSLWVWVGAIVPLGPDRAYVGEKPLDPLTLEFYRPQGQAQIVIHDKDRAVDFWLGKQRGEYASND